MPCSQLQKRDTVNRWPSRPNPQKTTPKGQMRQAYPHRRLIRRWQSGQGDGRPGFGFGGTCDSWHATCANDHDAWMSPAAVLSAPTCLYCAFC